jgi:hypothetical protein
MKVPCKPQINKILEKNEVQLADLIVGQEYLLEYNLYSENRTIKEIGIYLKKEIYLPPYVMTFFKTRKSTILHTMFHESLTRYYLPVADKIKRESIERQAFAQSINKLCIEKQLAWRALTNKNNIGNHLVKIYY